MGRAIKLLADDTLRILAVPFGGLGRTLVRATARLQHAPLTIPAQQAIAVLRPPFAAETCDHKLIASDTLAAPLRRSAATDVIKRQKRRLTLTATRTPATISSDHGDAPLVTMTLGRCAHTLAVLGSPALLASGKHIGVSGTPRTSGLPPRLAMLRTPRAGGFLAFVARVVALIDRCPRLLVLYAETQAIARMTAKLAPTLFQGGRPHSEFFSALLAGQDDRRGAILGGHRLTSYAEVEGAAPRGVSAPPRLLAAPNYTILGVRS